MLRCIKFLPQQLQSLSLFSTKPHHHRLYPHKNNSDDEDWRSRKANNVGEGINIDLHKSKGQHILTNTRVLDAIVHRAGIKPTDTVLEIGPGTGNLTLKLLQACSKVVAIEIDPRMIEILNKRVSQYGFHDRIMVVRKDALKMDFPQFDLIVANIPYGISSPLIAKIVFGNNSFRSATLLLQKEFAHRLLAKPGDSEYNRLAVNVNLVADVEFVMNVSTRDFVPCPKVDSSVVKIHPKDEVPSVPMNEWLAFTRTCFSKKNKTLGATFKQKKKILELFNRSLITDVHEDNGVPLSYFDDGDEEEDDEISFPSQCTEPELGLFKDKVIRVLRAGGFEDKRPSKLCNEDLLQLLSLFNKDGIHFHHQAKGKGECDVT